MRSDVNAATPDTTPIYRLIRTTRLLLRSSWIVTGLGLTLGLLLGFLVATTLADLVLPLAPVLRLLALLLVVVPACWALVQGVILPLGRRLNDARVARRIESELPGIHNRLVTSIDLDGDEQKRRGSPAFHRRIVEESIERIEDFHPTRLVDFPSLRRAALFSFVAGLAFLLSWTLLSDRLPTAIARIFNPFADIPPASGVVYTVEPGDARVVRGEDVTFLAHVEKGEPEDLRIELYNPKGGQPERHKLERPRKQGNTWKFTLNTGNIATGFEKGFQYRIFGGGTWSRLHRVVTLERPQIASRHVILHLPEYMADPEPRVGPPDKLEVSGPEGSRVEVVVEARGQVSVGEIQHVVLTQPREFVRNRKEEDWFTDQLPAGALAEGSWIWGDGPAGKITHTEPPAFGPHGHWFTGATQGRAVEKEQALFAWVYLVPEHTPDAIMLEWFDGEGWEHRAYWGDGRIQPGKGDSPARRHMGPLPSAGEWVRLEVPATAVGLAGRSVTGMGFKMLNGQCHWHKAGLLPPLPMVTRAFPMAPTGENQWKGSFDLGGSGLYRLELRNEAEIANEAMTPASFVAVKDRPPEIVVERPGADLTLGEPAKVPLVLVAADDFGLAEVSLITRRGDEMQTASRTLKSYTRPQRSDSLASAIDLAALGMKAGDVLHYRLAARDRKGQVTQTQEFAVRISADKSGADKQSEDFEKTQDSFRDKLINLMAEQAKVKVDVEKLAAIYAPVVEKVREAEAKAIAEMEAKGIKPDPTKPETQPKPQIDAETAKKLAELQKELAELAKKEDANAKMAEAMAAELKASADAAAKNPLIPAQVADQMTTAQQMFKQLAAEAMKNLADRLGKGADPKQSPPDPKELAKMAERLQKDLEAMKERLKALADARKDVKNDLADAIKKLEQELTKQQAGLTERELQELRDKIAAIRDELKRLGEKQADLAKETDAASAKELEKVEKKQADLEKDLQKMLDRLKEMLKDDKVAREEKRNPDFPDEPYTPEQDDVKVKPKEQDTDEPIKKKDDKKDGDPGAAANKKDDKKEEKEDLFMPKLGGPKPKVDPRYKDRQRPTAKKPKDGGSDEAKKEDLRDRQDRNQQNLDKADQALGADQQSLEQLLQQLQNASKPGKQGQGGEGDEAMKQLAELLKSPQMQKAMQMAAQMKRGQPGQGQPQAPNQQPPQQPYSSTGNLQGGQPPGKQDGELEKLDPAMRSVLLRLQPRLREEILQGIREEGPEAYRKLTQEYFKRLGEIKGAKDGR